MNYNVTMPSLGADMDQGKLMQWKIKPGDMVKKGDPIAVVETTKSTVEIESFRDGKVLDLVGKEGEEIPVGKLIAHFDVEGKEVVLPTPSEQPIKPVRVKISPAARRFAETHNIDLNLIKGSGREGQIELNDVESSFAFKAGPPPKPSGVNIREAIAMAMSRSKKEIPHYYLKTRIGLDQFMRWMDEKNRILPPEDRLMVPVVLFKAVIEALKLHPEMNGYYKEGKFEPYKSIHLGVAIALKQGGVLVPALLDAEKMTLKELNTSFQDLLIRGQKGELKNRELTEGTFTITNMGDLGTDEVFGVIFPPQVALIGLGRVHKAPVVENASVRAGFVIDITLSADHRVTDGLNGARFLNDIEKNLKSPEKLGE